MSIWTQKIWFWNTWLHLTEKEIFSTTKRNQMHKKYTLFLKSVGRFLQSHLEIFAFPEVNMVPGKLLIFNWWFAQYMNQPVKLKYQSFTFCFLLKAWLRNTRLVKARSSQVPSDWASAGGWQVTTGKKKPSMYKATSRGLAPTNVTSLLQLFYSLPSVISLSLSAFVLYIYGDTGLRSLSLKFFFFFLILGFKIRPFKLLGIYLTVRVTNQNDTPFYLWLFAYKPICYVLKQ